MIVKAKTLGTVRERERERELHFSEIELSIDLKKIVVKICFKTDFYCCLFLLVLSF